jgi:hypothetical protein
MQRIEGDELSPRTPPFCDKEDDALERAVTSRSRGDVGCFIDRSGYQKHLKTW